MLVVITLIAFAKSQETHDFGIRTKGAVRLFLNLPRYQRLEWMHAGMAKAINQITTHYVN